VPVGEWPAEQKSRHQPRRVEPERGLGCRRRDPKVVAVDQQQGHKLVCTPCHCADRHSDTQPLGAIDRDRLNTHGGSLAAGHPFGATGGRIVAGLAKALSETNGNRPGRGLISICAAGGLGVTAIMEAA